MSEFGKNALVFRRYQKVTVLYIGDRKSGFTVIVPQMQLHL